MRLPTIRKLPVERRNQIAVALLKFFLPWSLMAFYTISIFVVFQNRSAEFFTMLGAYAFTPLGKGSIIPLAVGRGFAPFPVAVYLAVIDIIVALFFILNWELLHKLPLVGGGLRIATANGEKILNKERWVRKLAFTGITLFMIQPFQPGGSITATVLGRIIGLSPGRLMAAITLGALINGLGFAYAASFLRSVFLDNIYLGVVTVILMGLLLHHLYHHHIQPMRARENAR